MKLGRKDYTISVKTGTDANKAKFKKECVQGEIYHATDTGLFYVAETTAGAIDATLAQFGGSVFTNDYSVEFDGGNDSMDVSSTSDFAFGSSGFSISFWLNGSSNNTTGFGVNIFDMRSIVGGSQPSLWIETKGANSLVKYYAFGSYRVSTTATLDAGTWYHVVITNDGSTSKIYLDGNTTPIGTGSDPTNYVAAPLRVGGYHGNNYYFDGLIDEFSIFSSELSASDVSNIYSSGVPDNLSSYSPIGWWRMGDNDNGTGTTITDQGSGGNDGTLTNGPTFSTDVPS